MEADLARSKRSGSALDVEARAVELHARRERLAREIAALVDQEHRLKESLRELGVSLAAH